jgi:hypothetical protein
MLGAGGMIPAVGAEVASEPVGLFRIPINPGPNFISVPVHRTYSYRGVVSTVNEDALNVTGNPAWRVYHLVMNFFLLV